MNIKKNKKKSLISRQRDLLKKFFNVVIKQKILLPFCFLGIISIILFFYKSIDFCIGIVKKDCNFNLKKKFGVEVIKKYSFKGLLGLNEHNEFFIFKLLDALYFSLFLEIMTSINTIVISLLLVLFSFIKIKFFKKGYFFKNLIENYILFILETIPSFVLIFFLIKVFKQQELNWNFFDFFKISSIFSFSFFSFNYYLIRSLILDLKNKKFIKDAFFISNSKIKIFIWHFWPVLKNRIFKLFFRNIFLTTKIEGFKVIMSFLIKDIASFSSIPYFLKRYRLHNLQHLKFFSLTFILYYFYSLSSIMQLFVNLKEQFKEPDFYYFYSIRYLYDKYYNKKLEVPSY